MQDVGVPAHRRSERIRLDVLGVIAAGGALGAPARYAVARLLPPTPGAFPWATFLTNVSGSFALGCFLIVVIDRFPPSRYLRPFFATGFLGAFTTFSTLAVDTDLLIKDGHAAAGVVYALGSVFAGLAAAWGGVLVARRSSSAHAKGVDEVLLVEGAE
ncbi:MAG TPA: CrcB family protein [Acidimicrobiales bacterium]|nr:CrcB family protein [Acidimicrobiales bacterium]